MIKAKQFQHLYGVVCLAQECHDCLSPLLRRLDTKGTEWLRSICKAQTQFLRQGVTVRTQSRLRVESSCQ